MGITVHIVMQAHLDPVWLWPWQAGLDEALNTARTACNLLDDYPDPVFTMGEAWRYGEIERTDPDLFARLRAFVRAGRWEVTGGWWIQPDCNFPSGFGFERQIEAGRRYFTRAFGLFPDTAYNVDSFGHAATLPGYLSAAGQRHYVMMRPQEHEMTLPARLFRWRGFEGGPEVTVFRIAGAYCTGPTVDPGHIRKALTDLPPGVAHTMCFLGVGDHGGGMTAGLIEWVRANAGSIDGATLVFSSPSRFFAAVAAQAESLPVVTGELQMHAVGCYSVGRGVKTRVQRAEHLLRQAEIASAGDVAAGAAIEEAWRQVCFNQFHDTLGGTCIPSAYVQQHEQLGAAAAAADDVLQHAVRARLRALPDDPLPRTVFYNASDSPHDGYVEYEPWTQWKAWDARWRVLDEDGRPVPFQVLPREAATGRQPRVLVRVAAAPGALRVLRLDRQGGPVDTPARTHAADQRIGNDTGVGVCPAEGGMRFAAGPLALPRLDLIDDRTDTWSHGVDRYPDGPVVSAQWNAAWPAERGPLMAALFQKGAIGDSTLLAEWRVYGGEPFVELRLRVHWREAFKLLKLTLPLPGEAGQRRDGIPGASLVRPNDGAERPMRDWTHVTITPDSALGVAAPDVFALDATLARLRFTLLRSPVMTHHDPYRDFTGRIRQADQGEHEFRFRFFYGPVTPERLEGHTLMLHRPLAAADLTRGMPRRGE